jgi:hypothetical protein
VIDPETTREVPSYGLGAPAQFIMSINPPPTSDSCFHHDDNVANLLNPKTQKLRLWIRRRSR